MSNDEQGSRVNSDDVSPSTRATQTSGTRTQLLNTLDRISDGFVALDRDWHYTYVNSAGAKMLQRDTPQDLIGKHIWTEYPEGVGQPFQFAYEKALQTQEPVVFEEFYEPWDLWFENRVYPSPDGLTVYFSDITIRKKSEIALKQTATLFAYTSDGIALTDSRSNIIRVNPAFTTITGLTPAEVEGQSIRLLGDMLEGDCSWSEVLEHAKWSGEIIGKRKGGGAYEQWLTKINVNDAVAEYSESVWIFSDISQDRLNRRIEKQLLEAQNLEVIGRLTGGVAHDFNNLLAAVLGNLELLKMSSDDTQRADLVETAIDATMRGADLTSNMLSFARRARLTPAVLNLNDIVVQTKRWIERTLPANIALRTSIPEQLWKVNADRASTESALLNLILNARDAMPDGGEITIECANVALDANSVGQTINEVSPGSYVMLAVSDTGTGIAQEIIDNIFDPFFTTKPTGMGTGLGLSMVQGFMKQSSGTVSAYSEGGVGTSIKLYWPACKEEVSERLAHSAAVERRDTLNRRILVAEDSSDVLKVVVNALEGAGYEICSAKSGDIARKIFDSGVPIDLLLTDIVMPGELQGPELAKTLRAIKPDLPVVFMTGYANEAAIHGNGLRPEDICLSKPVRLAELISAIEKSFEHS